MMWKTVMARILMMTLMVAFTGCGHKGPPKPPADKKPAQAKPPATEK